MIDVLIVDDHAVVRRGVMQILEDIPDVVVKGEASSSREAMQAVRAHKYDIVLLDIAMPDGNGIEALKQIKSYKPELHVLILSMYPEEQYALRALKAGASGYLTKESAPGELVFAIKKIIEGEKYITAELAKKLSSDVNEKSDKAPHDLLSDREFEVVCLLASGKTLSEIANELSLSVKSVSTYRSRILTKLGLRNTMDIVRYAVKHGLG